MRHTPGDSDYDDIQQIRASSNRFASLERASCSRSARSRHCGPEVLQLPDVVAEVSTLLKRLLGEKIVLEVTHDRNLGLVRADPVQLEQVLLNLAVNARDAMTGSGGTIAGKAGGMLRLRTKRVTRSRCSRDEERNPADRRLHRADRRGHRPRHQTCADR